MTEHETPSVDGLTIGILGGTGEQGRGLARRFAVAGNPVVIGSRSHDRAHGVAQEIGHGTRGLANRECAREADVVIAAVPWEGHSDLLSGLATELAGKEAIFATETKKIEEPALPELDEQFCTAFGVTEGGVPKLREDVTANMKRELAQALRNRNKSAVMDQLYNSNPLDIPKVLLEGQIRDMQAETMRRSGAKDTSQAPPREPLIEPARRRVALGLLLNDIIRREKIVADRARINERLDEMVSAYGDTGAMKRAYMQNADAMRQIENLALEDQAVEWVLTHAKVRDKPSTFKELMNFEA